MEDGENDVSKDANDVLHNKVSHDGVEKKKSKHKSKDPSKKSSKSDKDDAKKSKKSKKPKDANASNDADGFVALSNEASVEDSKAKKSSKSKSRKSADTEKDPGKAQERARPTSDPLLTYPSTPLTLRPTGPQLPFAHPKADAKTEERIFISLLKLTKAEKDGKRNSTSSGKSQTEKVLKRLPKTLDGSPPAVAIFGGDVQPGDVISHFIVMCEDRNVPYVFVKNHHELGRAQNVNRATTSTVILPPVENYNSNIKEWTAEQKTEHQKFFDDLLQLIQPLQVKFTD